jgi:hypothetical protein
MGVTSRPAKPPSHRPLSTRGRDEVRIEKVQQCPVSLFRVVIGLLYLLLKILSCILYPDAVG